MPIYEYQCTQCGKRLELIKKISDPPETDCPDCKQSTLQKLVSAAGFRLKGTGWYVTDFKNKSDGKPAAKAESSGSSGNADASSGAEAKPKADDSKSTSTESAPSAKSSSTPSSGE